MSAILPKVAGRLPVQKGLALPLAIRLPPLVTLSSSLFSIPATKLSLLLRLNSQLIPSTALRSATVLTVRTC
jgi:hypothetical protein